MSIQMLTQIFLQYGALFIFLLVLLEYMNLPGLPAGIIMPLAGIWASKGKNQLCDCYDNHSSGRSFGKLAPISSGQTWRRPVYTMVFEMLSGAKTSHRKIP